MGNSQGTSKNGGLRPYNYFKIKFAVVLVLRVGTIHDLENPHPIVYSFPWDNLLYEDINGKKQKKKKEGGVFKLV
jgi:hypothetical protein